MNRPSTYKTVAPRRSQAETVGPREVKTSKPVVVKKLILERMRERRCKKCFQCDEKWSPGHSCNKLHLYLIDEEDEETDKDEKVDEDQAAEQKALVNPVIYLHASARDNVS